MAATHNGFISAPMMPARNASTTRWRLILGLACLLAQAMVATSSLWHRHDHGPAPERCATCAAAIINEHGAPPADPPVLLQPLIAGYVAIEPRPVLAAVPEGRPQARGPPFAA
jgi:hypothetical protein